MAFGMRGVGAAVVACSLLAAGSALGAGPVRDEGPLAPAEPPGFTADLSASLDSAGQSVLRVAFQVPYTECQFIRVGSGQGAALEFLVVVRDGSGAQVAGDLWERRLVVESFEAAKAGEARIIQSREFHVRPGKYRVTVRLRDLNGGLESQAEREVEVAGLGKAALGLADLVLGECAPDSQSAQLGFTASATRRYAENLKRFCARCSVLDLRPGGEARSYRLHYRVRDEDDESRVEGDTVLAAGATRGFLLRPDLSGLSIGSYVLELSVEEGKRRWRTESDFEVEVVSAPQGRDWDTFLEILDYVASRPEMQALRAAQTPAERSRLWDEFWARRDPTPGTSRNEALFEFMRRVRYANTQFAGLGPGWRTDQGRIYIRYGAPDQIEDISATPTSPPLQVWHYLTANRRFVFADRYGFGRYELVSGEEP